MADEWATADTFDAIKLNRKTRFIGTGTQATEFITSPQSGQIVYATEDYSTTFKHDKTHVRNAANTIWEYTKVDESSESSIGTSTGSASINVGGDKMYARDTTYTLPTSEKFYLITAIEFYTSGGVAATMMAGADVGTMSGADFKGDLVAVTRPLTVAGSITYKLPCMSRILRGGTVLYPWVSGTAGGTTAAETNSGVTYRYSGAHTTGPPYGISQTLTGSGTNIPVLKVYYRGYI